MKKTNVVSAVVAVAVFVSGVYTPVFAAPTVAQVQQFVQDQPQTENPRVTHAQEAFSLAIMNYTMNKMTDELSENEKKIDAIFEAPDLSSSLQQTVRSVIPADTFEGISTPEELNAKLQELLAKDPNLEAKLLQAYLNNKYIKQLIPLLLANQDEYTQQDIDTDTFNGLVVSFTIMNVSLMQLQQADQ